MNSNFTFNETRVIGCLIEKEKTTPDQYPLSLNGLTNACNQKSNRDPVISLSEAEVQETVDELVKKHIVSRASAFGSRVEKYQHRFANTEFSEFQFNQQELGIICVLFLRGAQTPGELRSRSNRLCTFNDIKEVEDTLEHLRTREDGPFVVKLPREPGRRESRYAHLFSGEVCFQPESVAENQDQCQLEQLEARVTALEKELQDLKNRLDQSE